MRMILDEFGLTVLEAVGGLVMLTIIFYVFGQVASGNDNVLTWIDSLVKALIGG